jgi:hypothetical protein
MSPGLEQQVPAVNEALGSSTGGTARDQPLQRDRALGCRPAEES